MFKKLKERFTKYVTRIEVREVAWFTCDKAYRHGKYLVFPDGLRIIIEEGKYMGYYTQLPNKEG